MSHDAPPLRIVHLSDIHVWRYCWNPLRLANKRLWGMACLAGGRARRFRLERLASVVERIQALRPHHVIVTGDLTTTALPGEFDAALRALAPLMQNTSAFSVVPGNHDRYTGVAARSRAFETAFARWLPRQRFPWLRPIARSTAVLGLDPTRAHYSARGWLDPAQLDEARRLLEADRPERLIVACHYPLDAPLAYRRPLAAKRLENSRALRDWLATIGPHLYCCGHVHAAWSLTPPGLPGQLALNAGAPLLRDPTARTRPGFLEITLTGPDVHVRHHAWSGAEWQVEPMAERTGFLARE